MILNIKRLHKLTIVLLISSHCFSQTSPAVSYPKDYFSWPLDLPPAIVANFGELRPNHYHMGYDCRTAQKVNQCVMAAADGYIARIKVEPFGFGRSIYINHPNGFTTVYAHLNDFYPELEKYVKEQQYKLKSWKIDLNLPRNMFPVKKEMMIAYSGNTGGSQGPHLHLEIRDTKTEKNLNPGLFGFVIPDTIPPDIFRVAVYDRRLSTYEQSPKIYPLKKVNGVYVSNPPLIIANSDKISLGITASDRCTGSSNPNGIYETVLYDNDTPVIGFVLDNISYDETRYFNAHIDHKLRSGGGPYIQHLSGLPG
jgi:murein DD-endopeptidase MepM/ murein hydrolase activator NlpD